MLLDLIFIRCKTNLNSISPTSPVFPFSFSQSGFLKIYRGYSFPFQHHQSFQMMRVRKLVERLDVSNPVIFQQHF